MTKLQGDQKLKRELTIPGISAQVIVTLSAEGLTFKAKGMKLGVHTPWVSAIGAGKTSLSAPHRFFERPLLYLMQQDSKITTKNRTTKENIAP
jgi:hypothetical protein